MMTISEDPYKAHCQKCGYAWTKKTTKDPVCCPNCHSRKYKEPKKENLDEEPRKDSRGLIAIPELFINSGWCEPDYLKIVCPVCGYSYVSTDGDIETKKLEDWNGKGSAFVLNFSGECGHSFGLLFGFHKGETFCKVVNVEENEEEDYQEA